MQLVQEPDWPSLARDHRILLDAAGSQLAAHAFGPAAETYQSAYRLLHDNQPEGKRYHKGESLHNRGLALLWLGQTDEALRETIAAFVEDSASLAEEEPGSRYGELDRPAARNLVFVFGIPGILLGQLATSVRAYIQGGGALPDPYPFVGGLVLAASLVAPSGRRIIGRHRLEPEYRVFVAGGFVHLDTHLRPIRDMVEALNYEAVVAADYGVPFDWRSDDVALTLMGNCHYGIFDLTDPAGQMVELSKLPDRKHNPGRTLAVWDRRLADHPMVSYGMNQEALADWAVVPRPYNDFVELQDIIEGWLPSRRGP